jgi:hypothetical protein
MAKSTEETPSADKRIYQLKITLKGFSPKIWRRVQVPETTTLASLHNTIQAVMGWYNSHLHLFEIDGVTYGQPDPIYAEEFKNEKTARLSRVAPAVKKKFIYEYDFGDCWMHEILVEKILPRAPGEKYPVCIAGKRRCPPEDCGGIGGYTMLLETVSDPENPDHEQMIEWIGASFNPDSFSVEIANMRLRRRT